MSAGAPYNSGWLTVIGSFAQAIIAEELTSGHFTLRADKPDVKVSWQITGIRQDPWANAHRFNQVKARPRPALIFPTGDPDPEQTRYGGGTNWLPTETASQYAVHRNQKQSEVISG